MLSSEHKRAQREGKRHERNTKKKNAIRTRQHQEGRRMIRGKVISETDEIHDGRCETNDGKLFTVFLQGTGHSHAKIPKNNGHNL